MSGKLAAAGGLATRICAARLGDCMGMAAAGVTFLCLAPAEGPEAVFRIAGLVMGCAGILLSGVGVRGRMIQR